jgi:hypothetical protein
MMIKSTLLAFFPETQFIRAEGHQLFRGCERFLFAGWNQWDLLGQVRKKVEKELAQSLLEAFLALSFD